MTGEGGRYPLSTWGRKSAGTSFRAVSIRITQSERADMSRKVRVMSVLKGRWDDDDDDDVA